MKTIFATLFGFALALSATASSAENLNEGTLILDVSRDVKNVNFGKIDMTWNDVKQAEYKLKRTDDGRINFVGASITSVLDPKTFAYYFGTSESLTAPHTVESGKQDGIETKKTWKTKQLVTGSPASFCSSLEMKIESEFEVGEKENFELLIGGKKTTVVVYPVYERAYWYRCYSGKVFRKFLFSPEFGIPLSIESAMYSPNGRDVHNSHLIRVIEIKDQK